MSKKFRITSLVCLALFVVFNVQRRYFSGPPAKVGVSGWRSEGFPFPYRVENVTHTMSGPVITLIRQDLWLAWVNPALWLLLSYRFARWVERSGAAWWQGKKFGPDGCATGSQRAQFP